MQLGQGAGCKSCTLPTTVTLRRPSHGATTCNAQAPLEAAHSSARCTHEPTLFRVHHMRCA
jgi:hypothetical protein